MSTSPMDKGGSRHASDKSDQELVRHQIRVNLGKIADACSRALDQVPEEGPVDVFYIRGQMGRANDYQLEVLRWIDHLEENQIRASAIADEPDTVLLPSNDPFLPKNQKAEGKDGAA